jgi:hypothetical protein
MKQHDPPFAALRGRDQRRSVGESCPCPVTEFDGRFGKHLPRHRHFARNGETAERACVRERREMLRRCPCERASQIAAAGAQPHGNEIVCAFRHAAARETHEHAPVADEFRDPAVV